MSNSTRIYLGVIIAAIVGFVMVYMGTNIDPRSTNSALGLVMALWGVTIVLFSMIILVIAALASN